jgi:outer membrane receptor protein involved in Fe transport
VVKISYGQAKLFNSRCGWGKKYMKDARGRWTKKKRLIALAAILAQSIQVSSADVTANANQDSEGKESLKTEMKSSTYSDLSLEAILSLSEKTDIASVFQETPLTVGATVAAVTEEQWRAHGARRTFDALRLLPGTLVNDSVGGTQTVSIRGFTTNSATGTALLLDGVPMNTFSFGHSFYSLPQFNLGLLSKIEMIRGPGSTIYGSDAFFGVIALKTWDPTEDTVQAEVEAGSFGYIHPTVRLRQTIAEDLVFTGGASMGLQRDMAQNYEYTDLFGELAGQPIGTNELQRRFDQRSAFAALSYKKTELKYFYQSYDTRGWPHLNIEPFYSRAAQGDFTGNGQVVSLKSEIPVVGSIFAEPLLYYSKSEYDFKTGVFAGPVNRDSDLFANNLGADSRLGGRVYLKQELTGSIPIKWVAGYSVDRLSVDLAEYSIVAAAITGSPFKLPQVPERFSGQNRTVHGLLLQTDTRFFDEKVQLLAGGRYDMYSDFGSHFSPRSGLIFHPTQTSALKLSYSHAFRAPSASELFGISVFQPNEELQPETHDSFEVVGMWHPSKHWKTTINLFRGTFKNGISLVMLDPLQTPPTFQAQNVNEFRNQGAEFELRHLGDVFEVFGSGSYVLSEQIQPEVADQAAFPRWILNLGGQYVMLQDSLRLTLNNRHHFVQNSAAEAPTYTAVALNPYFRTDLGATYRVNHLFRSIARPVDASFVVNNLFNRTNRQTSIWGWNYEYGILDPGISAQFSVRVEI